MSKIRVCDKRCHQAKGEKCRCWCNGYFHGENASYQRERLQRKIEQNPKWGEFKGRKIIFEEEEKKTHRQALNIGQLHEMNR